ncbi:MAG: MATE family efflux transporter [Oscillospiraceae bacterium]|nr:MATE family efflux transporter [Oscillospiraceae bacterium]
MNTNEAITENPLGTERIGKLVVKFAVPSVISMVVNALYNVIDQIFIGQGVGYLGNGATNVIFPLTIVVISLGLLIGDGAAAYMSLKLGQKNSDAAAKGVGCSITLMFIVGFVLCLLFVLFLKPLCMLFGATDDNLPYALDYGRIISLGVLFSVLDSGMSGIIRADGSPKYTMAGLLVGCIVNVILDPIFIFVFDFGVKGAAWATVIEQVLNAVIYFLYIWKFKSIKLTKSSFHISGKTTARICRLGISSFITQMSLMIVVAVSNNALVQYGKISPYGADIPLTTMGITMKVNQIISAVLIGLSTGAQPIWGYNYGSKQSDRVKKTYRIVMIAATAVLVLAFFVFQLAPMSIIKIFGSESDLYNEFAVKCFKIFLLVCPINGFQMVTGVFFQAIGKPVQATVLSLTRQIVYLVPSMLLLPMILGVEGVLWAGPVADVLAFITAMVMLKLYWKKI